MSTSRKDKQSGIFLIEVMISILIFSIGVLGLVGLQAIAIQNSANAEGRTLASTLANDIVSQMWVRKTSSLSSPELSADITAWQDRVQSSRLPDAEGEVTEGAGITTVTVSWKAPSKTEAENRNKYETQVVVQ